MAPWRGLGVQLWAITQDLGQLEQLYGHAWQTFVGNAGVFQYFGSRDHKTAEYASQLAGITTIRKRSTSYSSSKNSDKFGQTSSMGTSESISYDDVQRPLIYADELMTLPRDRQILFVENAYPIIAPKIEWFADQTMRALQANDPLEVVDKLKPKMPALERKSEEPSATALEAQQRRDEAFENVMKLGRSALQKSKEGASKLKDKIDERRSVPKD